MNPSHLSTTLSSLKSLISLCDQTLKNPKFLPPKPQNDHFVPCPYNPHHLMPPESLFHHILNCPSPLHLDPPNYQNTLLSSSSLHHQKTHFTIHDSSQELCFSLDEYLTNLGSSSFFYRDCPAVVSLLDIDNTTGTRKTFTLPGILSIECANVVGYSDKEAKGFPEVGFRVLGSDLWFIRREIGCWSDYEFINSYPFNIVCAILGLKMVKESDLNKWVIVNSPRFGVVLDVYMRDHIFVLVGLCLKAVIKEALGLIALLKGQEMERGLKSLSFKCPILSQVLMWLASQLSVLYGPVNGKLFAINIFKQCLLESASRLLLFPLEQDLSESFDKREDDRSLQGKHSDVRDFKTEEPLEGNPECEVDKRVGGTVDVKVILVSQVAAAVAALHERSLLEAKIRRLRLSQPPTSHQRRAEHASLSNRADEERKKRPNYRPIIDHDGLPRQQSSNQETNKNKTREELLAEERDYKRRRMSYRGKKLKRTPKQVVRDIIEEYMDEIKQAGGIGCFEKGDEKGGMFPLKTPAHDPTNDADGSRKSNSDSFEARRDSPNYHRKDSHYDKSVSEDALLKDHEQWRQGLNGHLEHGEDQRSSIGRKHGGERYSRSTERHRSHDRSHERSSHRREQEDVEFSRTKHHEIKKPSSRRSNYHDHRSSYSVSNSRQRNTHDDRRADFLVQNAFDDRYDPSESHEVYEDDFSDGRNHVKPE